MPRVSVIIPAYNCEAFLGAALDSALAQTYRDYEVIVADDGSTDNTRDLVARYGSQVIYRYQKNRGLSAARNFALAAATGDLVAYLDADDVWYPQKLARQVEFMDAHPECGLVHSDVDAIDEAGAVVRQRFNHTPPREVPQGLCLLALLRRSHMQVPSVMVRHDLARKVGYFDERLRVVEDYLQWILVALEGQPFGYIDEPLAMYRWRGGSLSSSERRMRAGLIQMFTIILGEKDLAGRGGPEAVAIVRSRLLELGRELAYLERSDGDVAACRRRLRGLVKDSPWALSLYADLAKSYLPKG